MPSSFSHKLTRAMTYLALPFQYPQRGWSLLGQLLADRSLLHELPRLTPHRDWLRSQGIATIIDVGSCSGAFAYAMRSILPQAQIYSFEPLQDNFDRLVRNLSRRGHFQAFNTAIGDRQGELGFHRNAFSPSSSALEMGELHRRAFPHTAQTTTLNVPVAPLDDFLDRMTLASKVMLKVDVQGYEDAVLRGATKILQQVDLIEIEVSHQPLYEGQVLFDGIYQMLQKAGFRFGGELDNMLSPLDGSILQSDGLFLRVI